LIIYHELKYGAKHGRERGELLLVAYYLGLGRLVILRKLPPLSHERHVPLHGTAKNVRSRRYPDLTLAPFKPGMAVK